MACRPLAMQPQAIARPLRPEHRQACALHRQLIPSHRSRVSFEKKRPSRAHQPMPLQQTLQQWPLLFSCAITSARRLSQVTTFTIRTGHGGGSGLQSQPHTCFAGRLQPGCHDHHADQPSVAAGLQESGVGRAAPACMAEDAAGSRQRPVARAAGDISPHEYDPGCTWCRADRDVRQPGLHKQKRPGPGPGRCGTPSPSLPTLKRLVQGTLSKNALTPVILPCVGTRQLKA